MKKLFLGIDFGTSTNYVTKYDFAKQDAVPIENMGGYGGSNIFENSIYIESETNVVLGESANRKGLSDPMNYFRDIKRHIASSHWLKKIPNLDNRLFSAKDIAQLIFSEIKRKVEKNENMEIDGVVITVPYSYGDIYRTRLRDAAEKAGLHVIKIIEEPVAAAVSFGLLSEQAERLDKERILVFDFGGGTFDITIFDYSKEEDGSTRIEVLNTDGIKDLGGKDIDEILSRKFRGILHLEYDEISNEKERKTFQDRLIHQSSTTKEELSDFAEVDIYETYSISGQSYELELDLSRTDFDLWLKNNNIIGEINDALDRCLMDVDGEDYMEPDDIDKVLLAGGSSNIPIIYETITNYFGKSPISKNNLGELVGHGAGILAGLTSDQDHRYEIIRKVSKNIGISRGNKFITILAKNTQYGVRSPAYELLTNANKDSNIKITFYEGDSAMIENCEIVGSVIINTSKYEDGNINMSLSRDENEGQLICYMSDRFNKSIETCYLEDRE